MADAADKTVRKCAGGDCDKDADTLQCPTCQKIGKESFFCGQDCFKRNWVTSVFTYTTSNCILTTSRLTTKRAINLKVILSAVSSLLKSFLNQTQLPAISILFLLSRSRAPYDRYIHFHRDEPFPRRSSIQTMQVMVNRDQNRPLWDGGLSLF